MDWKEKRIAQLEDAVKRLSGPKGQLESKKLIVAVFGGIFCMFHDPGSVVFICCSYIIGQGLADLGKNKR